MYWPEIFLGPGNTASPLQTTAPSTCISLAGLKIQWKKTVLVPTQCLLHLGFNTDSASMTPDIKWFTVQLSLSDALAKAASATPLPVMDAASLLSRLSSLYWSHGWVCGLCLESISTAPACTAHFFGRTGSFLIAQASQAELTLLVPQLPWFNGSFIPSTHAISHVYTGVQPFQQLGHTNPLMDA